MYFEGKLRVRVCGILYHEESILLINHKKLTPSNQFWSFPGGEVHFGESLATALKREFLEETNLVIHVKKFLTTAEILTPTLHSIQFYFLVEDTGIQTLKKGFDPENLSQPIIQEVRFLDKCAIEKIQPDEKDPIFLLGQLKTFLNNAPRHFKFENKEIKMPYNSIL